jgi:predicted kinase
MHVCMYLSILLTCVQAETPHWCRANQDDLGSRQAVADRAAKALREGRHVVIDRTNVDFSQRANWLELARSHGN